MIRPESRLFDQPLEGIFSVLGAYVSRHRQGPVKLTGTSWAARVAH
jgi:hypothetical protein